MKYASIALLVLIAAAFFTSGLRRSRNKRIVEQRMEDIRSLADVYFREKARRSTNADTTQGLLALASRSGVRLHSPIPRDPSKPCFHVVAGTNAWVLEETNTTDTQFICVAGSDGAVYMTRRSK